MVNEQTVLNALQNVLINEVNQYLDPEYTRLSEANVLRDIPSVDRMPADSAVYIIEDRAEFEPRTTCSDVSTMHVDITIIAKRDTRKNLDAKVDAYHQGIYQALKSNMDLNGVVDFTFIEETVFYPEVEMNESVQGLDISVAIQYEKNF